MGLHEFGSEVGCAWEVVDVDFEEMLESIVRNMRIGLFVASLLAPVVTGLASDMLPVGRNAPQWPILIFFI